jgi:chorismate mutase/prephenate dehydratase
MPMPSRTRKINKARRPVTPRGATAAPATAPATAPAATAAAAAAAKAKATATAVDLVALRAAIDAVDEQLHTLLNERARLAQRAGISKHQDGHTVDYYRPEREAEVLRQALQRNAGPLRNEEIVRLFREIMSACLAQEEPLKVAFLGPEGTFTQQAVFTHFGHSVRALALPTVDEVFQEVEAGNADFGIVAIENSSEGTITNTLDRFLGSPLHICGEVELRIHHCLMGKMDALPRVLRVCSHSQALAQCRGWLDEHLPDAERVPVASNAEGARRARDEQGSAAIAGETAAEVYGLNILVREIEDRPDNATRCDRVAPIAPRCCCRSAIPSLLARCIGCSSHWRATASA